MNGFFQNHASVQSTAPYLTEKGSRSTGKTGLPLEIKSFLYLASRELLVSRSGYSFNMPRRGCQSADRQGARSCPIPLTSNNRCLDTILRHSAGSEDTRTTAPRRSSCLIHTTANKVEPLHDPQGYDGAEGFALHRFRYRSAERRGGRLPPHSWA